MFKIIPVSALCIIAFAACSTKNTPFYVGLQVYKDYDSSRTFDATKTSKNIYRPVKMDVFYPSIAKPATASLTFGDILDMYEQRFNFNNPVDSCKKTSLQLAQAFSQYFHIDTPTKLLQYPLGIYKNLALPTEKHPLVIYAASMNGSAWDNPVLFDSLVRHGYVVAVVSSVGKFPGFMSEAVDVNEQVRDILFAIQQMKTMPYVDAGKIGIASWSMGGTAAMKAAMINQDIRCILSLDGTEVHAYGSDTAWYKEYNAIRNLPPCTPQAIAVPYLYLRSGHPTNVDSIYNPILLTSSNKKYFLKMKDAIHEDFSCLPFIAKQVQPRLKGIHSIYHAEISKLASLFFDEYLSGETGNDIGSYLQKLVTADSTHYSSNAPAY